MQEWASSADFRAAFSATQPEQLQFTVSR
jgi:hypothetical protein